MHGLRLGFASYCSPGVYIAGPLFPSARRSGGNESAGGSFSSARHLLARVCGQLLAWVPTNFRSGRAKHRWMASLGFVGLAMLALHCRVVSRGTSASLYHRLPSSWGSPTCEAV